MQSLNFILICFQNKFTRYTKLSEFGIYFCISYFQMMLQDTVLQPILNHYISGVQNFEILYLFKVRFFSLELKDRTIRLKTIHDSRAAYSGAIVKLNIFL